MLALESYRDRARGSLHIYSQEHVPKKLLDFFAQDMLQLFDFERVLIDQMIPFDRDALKGRFKGWLSRHEEAWI
jgi:hypothetical protein